MGTMRYEDGTLIESWDDENRTYTDHVTGQQRPYTAEENVEADARGRQELLSTNNGTLRGGLPQALADALARQAEYQTVLDTTNATINSNPAGYLKTVARQGKRSERALIRLIKIVGELNASADTGTD